MLRMQGLLVVSPSLLIHPSCWDENIISKVFSKHLKIQNVPSLMKCIKHCKTLCLFYIVLKNYIPTNTRPLKMS